MTILTGSDLAHFGTVGMKWGHRKNRAIGYEDNQVKRDKQIYGNRGANRINKSLHNGNSISVARGDEKTRRDRVMGKNKYVRQGGKIAGATAGVLLANVGISQLARAANTITGRAILTKVLGSSAGNTTVFALKAASSSPLIRIAVSTGAASIGTMLAGDIAVSTNMRINGYDPTRK